MKYERFTWKAEKLQHLDDEVIMVVDNANKEWKGHILNIVDMLNELNDERMMYKTTIDKRIAELEEENEQLRKQIQNYEQLIVNSYVGEEETLDGFLGKYVIFEDELQKYRNKNEMIDDD